MTDREITLEDILQLQEASPEVTQESLPVARAPEGQDPNQKGAWSFVKTAARQDWAPYALARIAADDGIELDDDFKLGDSLDEKEWNELTAGLDDDTKENIAGAARSKSHAYWLVDNAKESQSNEAELASYGGWGVAGRVATGIIDPTNLLLAVGTGGVGVAAKAERIASAAKVATTLAEQRAAVTALGNLVPKAGTLVSAVKTGVATGAEAAALESVLVASSPDRDGWDVAYAGIGGLALGSAVGKVLGRGEADVVRRSHNALKVKLEADELLDAIGKKRSELSAALGDVSAARTQVDEATKGAVRFLSERDTDLASYSQFRHILESGGKANAKSPTSSATGIDQFTEGTWLGMVSKEKPAWAKGLTKEQLLELRKDPSKSAEMVAALDRDSTAALRKAGAPVNHFTLYAMHHFGELKGKRFALAADDVKMEDILSPAQLNANAYLKGKTKAEAIANWTQRAKKGGWDLGGAVDAAGISTAERMANEALVGFDRQGTSIRLKELEATRARQDDLPASSAPALSKAELTALRREASDLRVELDAPSKRTASLAAQVAEEAPTPRQAEARARLDELDSTISKADQVAASRPVSSSSPGGTPNAEVVKLREALGLADKAEAGIAAATRRRQETSGLLKALGVKAQTLDQLDALDTVEAAGVLRKEHLRTTGAAPAFGEDTLSAARTVGFDAGLHPSLEGTSGNAPVGRMKLAAFTTVMGKGTFSGVLRGSRNEVVRTELGVLVGNALGEVGDTATSIGASEIASQTQKRLAGRFNAAIAPAYDAWMKENGISKFFAYSRGNRERFMREVGTAIRGDGSASAPVNAAAAASRSVFAEFLKEAKDAGVQGFDNVRINANYLPRVFDFHALHRLNQQVGPDQLGLLIQKGIQEVYTELEDKVARRIGDAYITRMRELRVGSDAGMMQGMSFDDIGFLRQFLGDAKLGSDEIEEVVAAFAAAKRPSKATAKPLASEAKKLRQKQRIFRERVKTRIALGKSSPKAEKRMVEIQARLDEIANEIETARSAPEAVTVLNQEGNFRHAKMRQKFDENFAMDLRDIQANDGSVIRVQISDLFDSNVEALFGRYSRTMSGHIALAKVGIKSRADFQARIKRVERELEGDPDQLKNVKKMAEAAYDVITSRPLEDNSLFSELGRTGRDIAYAAQMENVGISNIPDLASLLAWGNFKYTRQAFFGGDVFGAMWKRGVDGKLLDVEWREIEETFGSGTDFLSNQVFSSYDVAEEYAQGSVGGGGVARKVSAGFATVGHAARVTGRAVTVGSGLAGITSMAQRIAARNVIYRLKDDVLRGGSFSKARAASLGLDDAMKERIAKQFKTHTGKLKGEFGDEVETSNFHLWDDHDARDALLYAVHRETRKNVQEEDLGDTFLWQHKSIGKIASQFRRFGLTAWTKQTLRGIAEHDAETASRVLLQFTLAAGVWQLRNELILAGMEASGADAEAIEKFRTEKLAPDRIAAAGIRNAGFAALLPDAYDTAADFAFDSPFFNVRNSGLQSNLLTGIPLVSLTGTMGKAASGTFQAVFRGDRQFDQRDAKAWQALIPFGNHLLVAPAIDAMISHLPEKDEE